MIKYIERKQKKLHMHNEQIGLRIPGQYDVILTSATI